jgi:hypothetical protein
MRSLPRPDGVPMRLQLDPCFRPCEPQEGEEIYPNGIFEFNITGFWPTSTRRDDSVPSWSRWVIFPAPAIARV